MTEGVTGADDTLERILAFLRAVGIEVREAPVAGDAFLPGVCIEGGALRVDRATLRWPGDLLHEAGHIAVTPAALRPALPGVLDALPVDAHGGEVEATAWAWAALVAIGLEPAVLFHEGGYHGRSAGLVQMFSLGVYPGAHGLAKAGMAGGDGPPYPAMRRWLRD